MNNLKLDLFKEINEKKSQVKNCIGSKYAELGTGIGILRAKYKALSQEWSKITDCIKNGSGLSSNKESRCFKYSNPLYLQVQQTPHLWNERYESHDGSERSSYSESENPPEYSEDETQIETLLHLLKKENSCCSSQ